jgi:Ca2+-binding RTX toxin-like protein
MDNTSSFLFYRVLVYKFVELFCSSFISYAPKLCTRQLNESHSIPKMLLLAVEVITATSLISTTMWLTPAATPALAQTAIITCYGNTATIVGTPESEDIVGTQGQDVIVTLGGRDRVLALGGDDIICGGPGQNTILGGAGDDLIDGFNGTDFLSGGNDNDRVIGGVGNDFLSGEDGDDRLDGGVGNDSLFGEDGDDFLFGDAIDGAAGRRNIDSGDGGPDFDMCADIETVTNCEG